ncbi:MAG: hypothetical protein AAFY91_13470 [Bacteroidota bacterium]
MKLILFLHTLIEGSIGLLFLFYADTPGLVPGFADGTGESYTMLMHMYGLAALFLAAVSGYLLWRIESLNEPTGQTLMVFLIIYHLGMAIIQLRENIDPRAAYLHFLLVILFGGVFGRLRGWYKETQERS